MLRKYELCVIAIVLLLLALSCGGKSESTPAAPGGSPGQYVLENWGFNDLRHSNTGSYSGTTCNWFLAGTPLTYAQQVILSGTNGRWTTTDSTVQGRSTGLLGYATDACNSGSTATILIDGRITHNSWAWTTGAELCIASTAGAATTTVPTTSGYTYRVIGYASGTESIWVHPDDTRLIVE